MSKQSRVWLRASNGWYYSTINKKQVRLGRTREQAEEKLAGLRTEEFQADYVVNTLKELSDIVGGWNVLEEIVSVLKRTP